MKVSIKMEKNMERVRVLSIWKDYASFKCFHQPYEKIILCLRTSKINLGELLLAPNSNRIEGKYSLICGQVVKIKLG